MVPFWEKRQRFALHNSQDVSPGTRLCYVCVARKCDSACFSLLGLSILRFLVKHNVWA